MPRLIPIIILIIITVRYILNYWLADSRDISLAQCLWMFFFFSSSEMLEFLGGCEMTQSLVSSY